MLQQTQVKTMLPYFARWHEQLPDFKALAAASEAKVLKLWEGLGYYSRARNLHKLAQAVAAMPQMPITPEAWRELPGIGPYTAAAITSISFGTPAAVVDGNVVRILARLTADETPYRDSSAAAKVYAPLADQLLNHDHPGDHNQAMMQLGATVWALGGTVPDPRQGDGRQAGRQQGGGFLGPFGDHQRQGRCPGPPAPERTG